MADETNWLIELAHSAENPGDLDAARQLANEIEQAKRSRDRFDLKTLGEVAEFFGQAEQTIRTWRLKTPPMPGEPGRWPIKQIVQWRCNWISQTDLAAAKRQQDFEIGAIALESRRIELEREKGQLLDRFDVELWASNLIVKAREALLQLPEMLAASAPQELKNFTREETERHIKDVLNSLARDLETEP